MDISEIIIFAFSLFSVLFSIFVYIIFKKDKVSSKNIVKQTLILTKNNLNYLNLRNKYIKTEIFNITEKTKKLEEFFIILYNFNQEDFFNYKQIY